MDSLDDNNFNDITIRPFDIWYLETRQKQGKGQKPLFQIEMLVKRGYSLYDVEGEEVLNMNSEEFRELKYPNFSGVDYRTTAQAKRLLYIMA